MPWKDTRPSARDPNMPRFRHKVDPTLLARLTDAHCHPTDDDAFDADVLRGLKTGKLCAMSSSLSNQEKTKEVHSASPSAVIPFFGVHPWFCHPISFAPSGNLPSKEEHYTSLFPSPTDPSQPHPHLERVMSSFPDPISDPISAADFTSRLEADLLAFPSSHVGEVGLDRAFRIPNPPHIAANKSNPKNTELATPLEHQLKVLEAQVDVAIKLGRSVSFHSVRAPQETVDVLKRLKAEKAGWGSIHVCLHSFGGSAETAKQIQKAHPNTFFSFATIISGRSPHFHNLLRAIEPNRLLAESDFSDTAEIDNQIWDLLEELEIALGWSPSHSVEVLEANWKRFITPPSERPPVPVTNRQKKRERKRVDMYVSEDEEGEGRRVGEKEKEKEVGET
ncbi:hypothetical protein JCM11251_004557 [Rhodosporidiobolus azoricus]